MSMRCGAGFKSESGVLHHGIRHEPLSDFGNLALMGDVPYGEKEVQKKRKMKIQNQNRDHQESRKELVPVQVQ